jgi:hypothetical protein
MHEPQRITNTNLPFSVPSQQLTVPGHHIIMSLKVVEKIALGSRKAVPFSVPISSTGGSFECTIPTEQVYLLTFNSAPDNRVTIPFIKAFMLSLDIIEQKFPPGVVVTTSGIGKFYSNGYDLEHVVQHEDFFDGYSLPILRRLLT